MFNPTIPPETIEQNVAELEAIYTRETGLILDVARPRLIGIRLMLVSILNNGKFSVYDDVAPAFRLGYLAEELFHYQQVRDAGFLGMTLEEIEAVQHGFTVEMEHEIIDRVRRIGFVPYDYRNYMPYTDIPRPSGVYGDDS